MRTLIALLLAAHGIGHVLFIANAWGYWTTGEARSWLIGNALGFGKRAEGIFSLLWLVPALGFVIGGWALVASQGDARAILLSAAAISLTMVVLWWGSLVTVNAFFALLVDVAVIAYLLFRPGTVIAPGS